MNWPLIPINGCALRNNGFLKNPQTSERVRSEFKIDVHDFLHYVMEFSFLKHSTFMTWSGKTKIKKGDP